MRLLLTTDGGIHVTVVGGDPDYLLCPEDEAPSCLSDGIATFETIHSQRLR